jgi:hypothetical protein
MKALLRFCVAGFQAFLYFLLGSQCCSGTHTHTSWKTTDMNTQWKLYVHQVGSQVPRLAVLGLKRPSTVLRPSLSVHEPLTFQCSATSPSATGSRVRVSNILDLWRRPELSSLRSLSPRYDSVYRPWNSSSTVSELQANAHFV